MRTASPRVAVIMATYNRAHLLTRSINSLLQQQFDNFEFILVDDGSADDTFERINPYLLRYPHFTYLKHSNRRQPASLNVGIRLARATYVTFLDSDDAYLPAHLQVRYDFMRQHPEVDIVHGGVEIIGNAFVPDCYDLSRSIHIDKCVAGGTIFGKREALLRLGGFRSLPFAADHNLVARAQAAQMEVRRLAFRSYRYYRDTNDSLCDRIN